MDTPTATVAPVVATYKPSGAEVYIVSEHDDGNYFLVRSKAGGDLFYAYKSQLNREDTEPQTGEVRVSSQRGRKKVVRPAADPAAPTSGKVNVNTTTAEGLTMVLKGVGIKTATDIKDLQRSMPGEKFRKLDQITSIGGVDWDIVLANSPIYVE